MNKRILAVGIAILVGVVGLYLASPLLALNALRTAVRDRDAARIEGQVDFPAVRESLKSQLRAALAGEAQKSDDGMAAFGAIIGSAIAGELVDTVVTPDGLVKVLASADLKAAGAPPPTVLSAPAAVPANDKARRDDGVALSGMEYLGLNRFRARLASGDAEGVGLVLERRGLFAWKLVRIELPQPDRKPQAPPAAAAIAPTAGAPTTPDELARQLPAAFTAAFPDGAVHETSGSGLPLTYEPTTLIQTSGHYVLLAGGSRDGAHAEVGTLAVAYLRYGPRGFELERRWLEAASGHQYAAAPDTEVRYDLLPTPVVLASGGWSGQGCSVSSADVVALNPDGPALLASVRTAYDYEGQDFEGRIVPSDGRTGFAVRYSGSAAPVKQLVYTIRGGKAQPSSAVELPAC